MSALTELKSRRDALKYELREAEKAIQAEETRLMLEKLASSASDGKVSRWFLVWFGYSMLTVRTKVAMTAEQLKSAMNQKTVKDKEGLLGPMHIEAVSKSRYYSAFPA